MLGQSVFFIKLCLLFYLISFLTSTSMIFKPTKFFKILAQSFTIFGMLAQLISIILRGLVVGRLPLSNVYEFIVLFSFCMALILLRFQRKIHSPYFSASILLLILIINTTAILMPQNTVPLAPALQSVWLQFHVLAAILAYGSFGVAFVMALLYLFIFHSKKTIVDTDLSELNDLDRKILKIVFIGYLFMSLVLITGSVWAEQVWGSWWSWDPKETWALITWLIYTLYIHLRITMGYRGAKSAWVAVIGFLAVIFTLFGVTWLLPGLHSYM